MKAILLMEDWRERKVALEEHEEAMADMEADSSNWAMDKDSGEKGCVSPAAESKFSVLHTVIEGCKAHIAVIEDQITDYYKEAEIEVAKPHGPMTEKELNLLCYRLEAYVIEIDG